MMLELNCWEEKSGKYEYDAQNALLTISMEYEITYTVMAKISGKMLIFTSSSGAIYRFQRITETKYKELLADYQQ